MAIVMLNFASTDAGWSSLVARRAHNPKVTGSNPVPATKNGSGCIACAVFYLGQYDESLWFEPERPEGAETVERSETILSPLLSRNPLFRREKRVSCVCPSVV